MPELPEVETIRRDLVPKVVGRSIRQASILTPRLTRRAGTPASVAAGLIGRRIRALLRRGKFFQFDLGETSLIVRLGMTGQLRWWRDRESCQGDEHTHAFLHFDEGGVLTYRDVRKFGELFLVPTEAVEAALRVGPEPLEDAFSVGALRRICQSGARVKSVLLDQRKIAGLGNIYADEALFRAKIRPTRRAASLSEEELRALRGAIRFVLAAAIRQRGSSISDFRDPCGEPGGFAPRHRVYQCHGTPCRVCGTAIRRILVAQRGTHFCPTCQR
ncbi:MAG: DNA-formamidopyrimidine glycosylase [candidate division NC10 bacterium]|nr:DNA-formamidopyrimidine glycosylase [candidate division NC10 bacterium]